MNKSNFIKSRKFWVLVCLLLIFLVLIQGIALVSRAKVYATSNVEEYDKGVIFQAFGGDLNSNLLIFPDVIPKDASVKYFEADFKQGLLDTDGRLILVCDYDDKQFAGEIDRLSKLEVVIAKRDGSESFTNKIYYDSTSYKLPAYVANSGFGNTYEYALVNERTNEIAYLYLAYPNPDKFPFPEFLMLDASAYDEKNTLDAFSIYYHSFDGGKSYIGTAGLQVK